MKPVRSTLTMRASFFLMLSACLQAPVHIEGVVLDASTGKPLGGVTLLIPAIYDPQAQTTGPPPVVRPAVRVDSGADGRFVLEPPESGPHDIYARKAGYEDWKITLSADEERRGVEVTLRLTGLPARGVVSGRAIDDAGRPIVGTKVELMGYRRMSQISLGAYSDHAELSVISTRDTNDRGEFRVIDVEPGVYFLRVPPPGNRTAGFPQATELSPLGAVFYPGVSGFSKAGMFEVHPGEEVRIGDLVLTLSALRPIRVRTTNLAGGNASAALPGLSLFGGPAPDTPPATAGLIDGVPAIRPDEPGNYLLCTSMVFFIETPTRVAHGEKACTDVVYTGDAMEIALSIRKPVGSLTGRVLVEQLAGGPAVPLADVRIGGVGVGPGANYGGTSNADGFFKSLFPVPDGPIVMRFLTTPDGYYITSIRQGPRDALTDGVIVSGEDTNLDVRVAKSSSTLRGRILSNDGKPVDRGTVVLIPQGALALRADKDNTHRTSTTNLNGTFELRNLIPGTYRAYGLVKIEQGAHLDSKFFKPFEDRSSLVEIAKDASASLELRQILN